MFNEDLKAKGELTISLFNSKGDKYFEKKEKNLVVLVGREYIAARMKDGGPTQMTHMEIGQGTSTPVAGDTALQVPFSPIARVALGVAGGTVLSNAITYTATFAPGTGTGTITEAAIFNATTAGQMLCRTTFAAVNKPASDSLAISWTVSILG